MCMSDFVFLQMAFLSFSFYQGNVAVFAKTLRDKSLDVLCFSNLCFHTKITKNPIQTSSVARFSCSKVRRANASAVKRLKCNEFIYRNGQSEKDMYWITHDVIEVLVRQCAKNIQVQ